MNADQKKVLQVGGLIVVLMCLFPPWIYFDNNSSGYRSAGYHFILLPPALKSSQEMFGNPDVRQTSVYVLIDRLRLILQLSVTIPFFVGLLPLVAGRRTYFRVTLGWLSVGFAFLTVCFIVWLYTLE